MVSLALLIPAAVRSDEPYARSRDYDLQNIRTHLWFDLDNRKIRGEATETISALRDDVSQLKFDSVALNIESVTVDGAAAKFSTTATDLIVTLARPAKRGEQHEVVIRYERPAKEGPLFHPARQELSAAAEGNLDAGRSGRHALLHSDLRLSERPHDFRNDPDRAGDWITVSNGKLLSVKDEPDGTENLGLEAVRAAFDLPDFRHRRRIRRKGRHLARHSAALRGAARRGGQNRPDVLRARSRCSIFFPTSWACPIPGRNTRRRPWTISSWAAWKIRARRRLRRSELVHPQLAPRSARSPTTWIRTNWRISGSATGDLQGLGESLAERRLRDIFRALLDRAALRRRRAAYEFWRDQRQWFRQKRLYHGADRHSQFHRLDRIRRQHLHQGRLGAADAARTARRRQFLSRDCTITWKQIAGKTW